MEKKYTARSNDNERQPTKSLQGRRGEGPGGEKGGAMMDAAIGEAS